MCVCMCVSVCVCVCVCVCECVCVCVFVEKPTSDKRFTTFCNCNSDGFCNLQLNFSKVKFWV